MSEEIELEMKELQDKVSEAIEDLDADRAQEKAIEARERKWFNAVALSAGIISALAAIAAMQGNYLANEGMLAQIHGNDQWSLYESKSTKRHIEQNTVTILRALGKQEPSSLDKELKKLGDDQRESQSKANELEKVAGEDLEKHERFAYSVAAFQIAISLCAVAALLKRKPVWYMALGLAFLGSIFMAIGYFA
jgi:hypothetical protein